MFERFSAQCVNECGVVHVCVWEEKRDVGARS